MLQDLQFALRNLRKNPSFALLAMAALAIGIGANTAIFSVVDTVLLKPMAYPDGDRIVFLWSRDPRISGDSIMPVTPADAEEWRAQAHSFVDQAWSSDVAFNMTGEGDPEMLIGYAFEPRMFAMLGLQPALGRTFQADDGGHVVVLSDHLWKRRFGGERGIVGRKITLDHESYTVLGVMPPAFEAEERTELWSPLVIPPSLSHSRERAFLRIRARLAPGVSMEQAKRELSLIAARQKAEHGDTNQYRESDVITLRDINVGEIRPLLLLLLFAVGLVLLLVCNNLASLLLARASARQREITIRVALGASRLRLIRQLLTESVVLSVISGAVGLVVALWGTSVIIGAIPTKIGNLHMPHIEHVPMDGRVLAFAFLVSLVTGIVFGLVPALQASRPDLERTLREQGGGASVRGSRLRNVLVGAEIALALVLACGAGLLARSFEKVANAPLGFEPGGVMTARAMLPETRYGKPEQQQGFVEDVLTKLRSEPGVESAGAVSTIPLSRWWAEATFFPDDRPSDEISALFNVADAGYFAAMHIPLLSGRMFDTTDRAGAPAVCLVDQTLATQVFGGANPVGRRINSGTAKEPQWRTIIGVVGNIAQFGPTETARPTLYVPFSQKGWRLLGFVVRGRGNMAGALRSSVTGVDGEQPISYLMPLGELVTDTLAPRRVPLQVLTGFAALALALAGLGVYGVMAFTVAQRRREIGIRVALGAHRRDVARLVLGRALRVTLLGIAGGLVIALALGRLLQSLLYQVGASDPLTLAGTAVVMTAVALLGAWLPARAATRTDPMVALRND
jgi:putative ABC transport system permease protein